RTFDINLGALLQILLNYLAEPFVEDHDAMPLGLFLTLAGPLVAPGLGGGDAQIGDRPPVLCPPDFRILAQIPDQNHLVHASRHRRSPLEITGKIISYAGRPAALACIGRRPYTLVRRAD